MPRNHPRNAGQDPRPVACGIGRVLRQIARIDRHPAFGQYRPAKVKVHVAKGSAMGYSRRPYRLRPGGAIERDRGLRHAPRSPDQHDIRLDARQIEQLYYSAQHYVRLKNEYLHAHNGGLKAVR